MSYVPPDVAASKADLENDIRKLYGDDVVAVHVTPTINEACKHDWVEEESEEGSGPAYCNKCGLSFTRYIHCCMP